MEQEIFQLQNDLRKCALYGSNLLKDKTILIQQIEHERKTHKEKIEAMFA